MAVVGFNEVFGVQGSPEVIDQLRRHGLHVRTFGKSAGVILR